MKKVVCALVCVLMILMMFPVTGLAAGTFKISVSGPSKIHAGDTVTYNINMEPGTAPGGVLGFEGTLKFDSAVFEYKSHSVKLSSPWSITYSSSTKIMVGYDDSVGSGAIKSKKTVLSVTFKVKSVSIGTKATVTVANAIGTDGNNKNASVSISGVTSTVSKQPSSNNNLESLSVDQEGLSPVFSSDRTNYELTVPFSVSSINVTAKAEDPASKVSVSGNKNLVPRKYNNVTITVTAEDGSKKEYVIKVYRERDPNEPPNSNNYLSSLVVDKGTFSPAFNKDQMLYVVYLPYEISALNVSANTENEFASFEVKGNQELNVGDNRIEIIVTAENGDKRTYIINAKRAPELTGAEVGNKGLSEITIEGGTISPSVSEGVYVYDAYLPETANTININAVAITPGSMIEIIGDKDAVPGMDTTITLLVSGADGTRLIYLVNVHVRKNGLEAGLIKLEPSSGTLSPAFNENTFYYELNSADGTLEFETIAFDENADIERTVYKSKKGYTYVTFIVTAQDGKQKIYTVKVNGDSAAVSGPVAQAELKDILLGAALILLIGMALGFLLHMLVSAIRSKHPHGDWVKTDSTK